jgi:putative transcriptional regulator
MNRIPKKPTSASFPHGVPQSERVSLAGCVLAAHADMSDSFFRQGVCLIVEHTDEATVGIMLNRPLAMDPAPLWKTLFEGEAAVKTAAVGHFHFGGPRNGPLVAIHNDANLADGGNSQGVYVSAQAESLQKLAATAPEHLHWYIGQAVWGKSQLEQQIVDGKWYVVPALPGIVFAEESHMWSEAIRFAANSVIASLPGVDHFPARPWMN